MSDQSISVPRNGGAMFWASWVMSGLVIAFLLMDITMKLMALPVVIQTSAELGWSGGVAMARGLGVLLLACTVLYVVPQTTILGAVLLTGYLGGAISQYARIGEPYPLLVPLTTALLAWAGLYLREERLRALLPFRRKTARAN